MKKYIDWALALFLGGMMIYGSYGKFVSSAPTAIEAAEKVADFTAADKVDKLPLVLYIQGLKQTGYFWIILGICELLFGILLIVKPTRNLGAILLLPISFQIFLFHLFLEPHELFELFLTGAMFGVNIYFLVKLLPVLLPQLYKTKPVTT